MTAVSRQTAASPAFPRRPRFGAAVVALTVASLLAPGASAESKPADRGDDERKSFSASFGLEAERRALEAGGMARGHALERLWGLSHHMPGPVADLLDRWLAGAPKLSDVELWRLLRPLAALHRQPSTLEHLANALAGQQLQIPTDSPYAPLIAEVSALALAKSGSHDALKSLGEWLRRPSERALIAQRALLTHRPPDLGPLLEASGPPTATLLETLGSLGDPRAIPFLARVVKRSTADIQGQAAKALARLGVRETLELATLWLKHDDSPVELVSASAFALILFDHPRASAAYARLLDADAQAALDVAAQVGHHPAVLPLADHLDELPDLAAQRQVVDILSQQGDAAVAKLEQVLRAKETLRWDAARALSEMGSPEATSVLQGLIREPATRAPALAALVSLARLHAPGPGGSLLEELKLAAKSADPIERSVGLSGLAALDEHHARRYLRSDVLEEVVAATLAGGLHGEDYLQACVKRLHDALQMGSGKAGRGLDETVLTLSSALSFASHTSSLSTQTLRVLARSESPIAPVAQWHGWLRGANTRGFPPPDVGAEPLPRAIYTASQAFVSPAEARPSKAFELLESLATDPSPAVRAACVAVLRRSAQGATTRRNLDWHASFDPSPLVRDLASAEAQTPTLRALWLEPPERGDGDARGYWASAEAPAGAPFALFIAHGHPVVAFVRSTLNQAASFKRERWAKPMANGATAPFPFPLRLSFEPLTTTDSAPTQE